MCEVDDLSHAPEAQWKDRHTLFRVMSDVKVITEERHNWQVWIVDILGFSRCANLSLMTSFVKIN